MSDGFGAMGKMPALGDFLRLNLPPGFVARWDDWLQGAMLSARDALGQGWNDCYLSAPIWRFSLPAGMAGARAMSGILMASVDRVGRQYPLTLAAPAAGGDTGLRHFANGPAFARLEDIALTALEDETSRDALSDALAGVALRDPPDAGAPADRYAGMVPPDQALAARQIRQTHPGAALWTTALEDDHRMLLTPGLPDAGTARALFDLSAPLWQARAEARSA